MTRFIAAAGLCLALSACASGIAGTAATVTRTLPADTIAKLETTCRAVQPALDVAAGPTMPERVRNIAVYGRDYCAALLAGSVPATTDANTPRWLYIVIRGVDIAAKTAGIILPLVL